MKCCEARASLRALYTKPIAAVIPARSANGFVFFCRDRRCACFGIPGAFSSSGLFGSPSAVYGIGSTIGKILIIRREAILGRSSLILLSQAIGF